MSYAWAFRTSSSLYGSGRTLPVPWWGHLLGLHLLCPNRFFLPTRSDFSFLPIVPSCPAEGLGSLPCPFGCCWSPSGSGRPFFCPPVSELLSLLLSFLGPSSVPPAAWPGRSSAKILHRPQIPPDSGQSAFGGCPTTWLG